VGEIGSHEFLVSRIVGAMNQRFAPLDDLCFLIDNPAAPIDHRPPLIGGKRPDVYVKSVGSLRVVALGEAKTAQDIENTHTIVQITEYLNYLKDYPSAYLMLAVPWHQSRLVRAIAQRIQRERAADGVSLIVLDDLPG
jgi:hypothetical protein